MSDDDDAFTPAELETLADGVRALGGIDARMTALKHTLCRYLDEPNVATGHYKDLMADAAEAVELWEAFADTPFGLLFDPRVSGADDDD